MLIMLLFSVGCTCLYSGDFLCSINCAAVIHTSNSTTYARKSILLKKYSQKKKSEQTIQISQFFLDLLSIEKKRLRGRNRILLLNKCLATFHSSNFDHH